MLVYIFAVWGLAYSISFNLNGMFICLYCCIAGEMGAGYPKHKEVF